VVRPSTSMASPCWVNNPFGKGWTPAVGRSLTQGKRFPCLKINGSLVFTGRLHSNPHGCSHDAHGVAAGVCLRTRHRLGLYVHAHGAVLFQVVRELAGGDPHDRLDGDACSVQQPGDGLWLDGHLCHLAHNASQTFTISVV